MADITQTQVLQDLSFLLGESAIPNNGIEDRKTFIQRALERVYRLHDFPMNKITATVALISGTATLPSTLGQDSKIDARDGQNNVFDQIPYEEQQNYIKGSHKYWLEGYEGSNTYFLKSLDADVVLKLRFTTTVPLINGSISTPFGSSMALARGALVYYRQAEDPQADISQDEAIFQEEVDEVWKRYRRSRPQKRIKDLYEVNGTFVGDTNQTGGA
jgi:hypothetical protein